jgi:oligoendopeptidase F
VQRWDLADLYPTPEAWDAAYTAAKARAEALGGLQAGMGNSATSLLKGLVTISDVRREVYRLYTYSKLKGDEDLRFAPAQERNQRAQALAAMRDEKTSWIAPAIQALGTERVNAFMAVEPELKRRFDFYLKDTLRSQAHTLSPEGEGLLAASSIVLAQPNNIYQQLAEAELPRSKTRLSNGKTITLTQDAYEVHPYVLLNHSDDFESLSTFAHEWGHAVHTMLSNQAQPYEKADSIAASPNGITAKRKA